MTKKPRTFVLRYNPCGCKTVEGCTLCNHTGYRTEHVPLADAILEIEEENARLYLDSVSQKSPTVGKPGARRLFQCQECNNIRYVRGVSTGRFLHCHHCNLTTPHIIIPGGEPALLTPRLPRQSGAQVEDPPYPDAEKGQKKDAGPEPQGCPACGYISFTTMRYPPNRIAFNRDGRLRWPESLGGFKCRNCGQHVPELPIPPK